MNKKWTNNEAIEMMHTSTAKALQGIAEFVKNNEFSSDEIVEFLLEISEAMLAQAVVVRLRDQLKTPSSSQ